MKKIIVIAACLSMVPMLSLAAQKESAGTSMASLSEVCAGKAVGDKVELQGKNGKKYPATCQERKGQLLAIPSPAAAPAK